MWIKQWLARPKEHKTNDILSYRPILTPKTVLPLFFVVGVLFAPIGGLLLWASAQVMLFLWYNIDLDD
jgi:hypothetical protein